MVGNRGDVSGRGGGQANGEREEWKRCARGRKRNLGKEKMLEKKGAGMRWGKRGRRKRPGMKGGLHKTPSRK